MNSLKILCISLAVVFFNMPAAYAFLEGGSFNTHDMQSIREQQFRYQEFNDYKDLQEQKIKHQREEQEVKHSQQPMMEKVLNRRTNSQFVEDEGQIKIRIIE